MRVCGLSRAASVLVLTAAVGGVGRSMAGATARWIRLVARAWPGPPAAGSGTRRRQERRSIHGAGTLRHTSGCLARPSRPARLHGGEGIPERGRTR